jgi:hypothetical protein
MPPWWESGRAPGQGLLVAGGGAQFRQSSFFSARIRRCSAYEKRPLQKAAATTASGEPVAVGLASKLGGVFKSGLGDLQSWVSRSLGGLGVAQVWAGKEDAPLQKIHWSQPSPQSIHSWQTDRNWVERAKDQVPELLVEVLVRAGGR